MAEIDSLGTNYYYSGVQNASNEAIKRNTKKEETQKTGGARKVKFSELLKGTEEIQPQFAAEGLPEEIRAMSIDDAAVYLADAVSNAGNSFSDEQSQENLENFKRAVSQFIRFVVQNNYKVNKYNLGMKRDKRTGRIIPPPRILPFSDYTLPKPAPRARITTELINEKLDALARETLSNQMKNPKILAQVNELKGLIVDLMSS